MYPQFRRRLRPIATVILVFFSWFCIEPWHYAALAQPSPTPPPTTKSAAQRFDESLRSAQKAIDTLGKKVSAAEDITQTLAGLKEHRLVIEAADPEIRSDFSVTKEKIKAAGLPATILARHNKAVAGYVAEFAKLRGNL